MRTTLTAPPFRRASSPHPAQPCEEPAHAAPCIESDSPLQLQKPSLCPCCGGRDVRLILYGRPNAEALAMIWRGEACLGRASIDRWLPDWKCQGCGREWSNPDDPAKQNLERLIERVLGRADEHRTLAA